MCLARYSPRATTTNQPTNRAPNEPARPICAQESILWAKFGLNPNFYGRGKCFGTHITENHLGTLFALFFGRAFDQMGQKCQYLYHTKKILFPNYGSFSGLNPVFGGFRPFPLGYYKYPGQRNLVGPSRPSQKWPTMTTDLVPAVNTEKRPFLRLAEKCFLAKNPFFPKKHLKFAKGLIFIWKRVLFCLQIFAR